MGSAEDVGRRQARAWDVVIFYSPPVYGRGWGWAPAHRKRLVCWSRAPTPRSPPASERGGRRKKMATTARVRPAALILTPTAEARIADLMGKAPEGAIGV